MPQNPFDPSPGAMPRRRTGVIAVVVVAVAAVLVAGVGVWFLVRPPNRDGTGAAVQTASPPTAVSSPSATASAGPSSAASTRPAPAATAGSAGSSTGSLPVVAAPATTAVTLDPMGGPRSDIACGTGYIVQVASELDQGAFAARVSALRAAGTLPAESKWTETSTSCPIFANQQNVYVLYVGPFADWVDACPARLSSPADALLKQTDPGAVGSFMACICPAYANNHSPPPITTIGQESPWVGELQRVLGAGLDYNVGDINAEPSRNDPGRWGIYTAETAAAVGRYQADHGLPVTEQVDGQTWGTLEYQWCGLDP